MTPWNSSAAAAEIIATRAARRKQASERAKLEDMPGVTVLAEVMGMQS
jgi:hypothetical protein